MLPTYLTELDITINNVGVMQHLFLVIQTPKQYVLPQCTGSRGKLRAFKMVIKLIERFDWIKSMVVSLFGNV